jgi:hypothetical protein
MFQCTEVNPEVQSFEHLLRQEVAIKPTNKHSNFIFSYGQGWMKITGTFCMPSKSERMILRQLLLYGKKNG